MASSSWNDLPKRLSTASLFVPLLLWIFRHDTLRVWFWHVVGVACLIEYSRVLNNDYFFLMGALVVLYAPDELLVVSALLFCGVSTILDRPSHVQGSVFLLPPLRTWLQVSKQYPNATLTILATVWMADSGAMVVGRLLGRKILPNPAWLQRLSPKKSLEGMLGGIVVGTLTYTILFDRYNVLHGLILCVAAIVGDLWESKLKRQFHIKDTSSLLPGHGGIIDRFDSSLLTVVVYQYLQQQSVQWWKFW